MRTDDAKGFKVLRRGWVAEYAYAWISGTRHCVPDYVSLPIHHEPVVHVTMTMSRRLARRRRLVT